MIAQYEAAEKAESLYSPGLYGLTQAHKHLPEMQKLCGLKKPPVFTPIVDDYYKGMAATVPLHRSQLTGKATLHQVWQALADHYAGKSWSMWPRRGARTQDPSCTATPEPGTTA